MSTSTTNAQIPGTGSTTRKPGQTTALAAGTGGLSGAVATILLWIATLNGLEVPAEVGAALGVILTVAGAVVGGWLSPSTEGRIRDAVAVHMTQVATAAEPVEVLPDQVEQEPEEAAAEPAGYVAAHAAAVEPDQVADEVPEPVESPDYTDAAPADLR